MKRIFKLLFFTLYFTTFVCSCIQKESNKNELTDLFIGTSGDNGQVDPAACVPFGMVRVAPDMIPRSHTGYDYAVNLISGFTINRISGIGCGGNGGNLSIRPALQSDSLSIIKNSESAAPGFYGVTLNNGVVAELTATKNVAIERFSYPSGDDMLITLDVSTSFAGIDEASYQVVSDNEIKGFVKAFTTCGAGKYQLFFNLISNQPFQIVSENEYTAELSFGKSDNKPVEIRIAVSPIDDLSAKNENNSIDNISFSDLKNTASSTWNKLLNTIDIKGGTPTDQQLFYTSLYRTFLSPFDVTSIDRKFVPTDGSIQSADDFTYYSSWSMWDSYRTKFPLITLVTPNEMKDIAKSLGLLYVYEKQPWATQHECVPTVRTEHTIPVLLDVYNKGITDINLAIAYEGMKKEINSLSTRRPDEALETCIDLWAISKIATILNKADDAKLYEYQADSLFTATWTNDFKTIDSTFVKMRGSGLYQGTRWIYRWSVPQYLNIMSENEAGKEKLAEELTYYYANNLYNHTNEPGIHAPYLFNRLGHPEQTQQIIRDLLTKETKHLYGGNAEYPQPVISRLFKNHPEGFLPEMDEDDGTMSAWYVFTSIGLYPLIVGEPWYEISSPIFDSITLSLPSNKQFVIKTTGRKSAEDHIKLIRLNGKDLNDFRINHNDIMQGGTLELFY